jgi:hypothetical protein
MVDVDKLPAIQELVLEVLAARHRLGEQIWTLSRKQGVTKALSVLEGLGLVGYDSGVVEGTWKAWLTAEGREAVFSPTYVPPASVQGKVEWQVRYVFVKGGPHDRILNFLDDEEGARAVVTSMVTGVTPDGLRQVRFDPEDVSLWRRTVTDWEQAKPEAT